MSRLVFATAVLLALFSARPVSAQETLAWKFKDGDKARETEVKTVGKGSIKTLFDDTPSPELSAGEAEADLKKAFDRIREALQLRRSRAARIPTGTVKDW